MIRGVAIRSVAIKGVVISKGACRLCRRAVKGVPLVGVPLVGVSLVGVSLEGVLSVGVSCLCLLSDTNPDQTPDPNP